VLQRVITDPRRQRTSRPVLVDPVRGHDGHGPAPLRGEDQPRSYLEADFAGTRSKQRRELGAPVEGPSAVNPQNPQVFEHIDARITRVEARVSKIEDPEFHDGPGSTERYAYESDVQVVRENRIAEVDPNWRPSNPNSVFLEPD
jgi:hypothetical protein